MCAATQKPEQLIRQKGRARRAGRRTIGSGAKAKKQERTSAWSFKDDAEPATQRGHRRGTKRKIKPCAGLGVCAPAQNRLASSTRPHLRTGQGAHWALLATYDRLSAVNSKAAQRSAEPKDPAQFKAAERNGGGAAPVKPTEYRRDIDPRQHKGCLGYPRPRLLRGGWGGGEKSRPSVRESTKGSLKDGLQRR